MATTGNSGATPRLRFPEFRATSGWTTTELGQVAKLVTERAGTSECTPYTVTSGIGLVSQHEKLGRTIAGKSLKNYIVLQRDDFAFNKSATKAYPQGYIARYAADERAAVPNSIFTCFRVDKRAIDPAYLDYLFSFNLHGRWLRKYLAVGARAHGSLTVADDDLLAVPIPLPEGAKSLQEQRKIAACLTSLGEVIAAQSLKVEALKAHKQGLMQELFPRDGETVPRLRFPEFRDRPEWEVKQLRHVAAYENGKAYEQDTVARGKYIVVNARFISTDGAVRKYSNAEHCIATAGDVLMVLSDLPKGRALARCFFVDQDDRYAVNQRVCRLTNLSCDGHFLLHALNRHPYLLAFDDGLGQTHLRKEAVLDCPISLPTTEKEQKAVADCLCDLDAQIAAELRMLDVLQTYRMGLMQQLFPSAAAE
jgi:type I restriction enzyme, S subunit